MRVTIHVAGGVERMQAVDADQEHMLDTGALQK